MRVQVRAKGVVNRVARAASENEHVSLAVTVIQEMSRIVSYDALFVAAAQPRASRTAHGWHAHHTSCLHTATHVGGHARIPKRQQPGLSVMSATRASARPVKK